MEKPIKSVQVDALIEFHPGFKETNPEAANAILAQIRDKIVGVVDSYIPASGEYQLNHPPNQTGMKGK